MSVRLRAAGCINYSDVAVCFLFSFVYHALDNHSASYSYFFNHVDYLGIVLLIWGASSLVSCLLSIMFTRARAKKFSLEPTSLVEDLESTGKNKDVEERQRGMEKGYIRLV